MGGVGGEEVLDAGEEGGDADAAGYEDRGTVGGQGVRRAVGGGDEGAEGEVGGW